MLAFFIWILNCITAIAISTTGTTTTDPSSSSLFYSIVTTNDTVDNIGNGHQFQDGNITTTTTTTTIATANQQLANKFNKNVNLTSSDSMMNLFELMMPQYLLSNSPSGMDPDPHFNHHHHPHHHHGHHHHGHHHHGHHGQPDFRFAPALMDPEPILVSTEPQRSQNPEVQLIIDYYNQLYNNDQPRTFPFTTPALEQFTPTVSYSLDEFSSFMPSYQPIFTTTNETPCSLEKSAENYAKTKTTKKRPSTAYKSTDDDVTDCSGGDDNNDDDHDDHHNETSEENSDDNSGGGGGGRDDDDTPLPYDPFEYLNQYRKTIPHGGDTNHDGSADSKPDDGGGGGAAEEEETNNNNHDDDHQQEPSKSTDGEENGGDGDGESEGGDNKEVEEVDKTGSGTNGDNNNNDTGEQEPDSEPEPETNDSKTEPNLIELDTKTARKNEPNDWEPKDDDDFDQDESSSLPIRMVNTTTTVPVVSGQQNEPENRTRIRSKRSLSTVIDQLRMVNDQFNQIDSMDPIHDLHPSSSRSMLPPNLMPYARPRPRPMSPLSMSAANLLGSPNYFDYWNQASIHRSRANAHWKHHLRHHPDGAGFRVSNHPHPNHYQASKAKSMFLKNHQAYPYMKLNRQKFYPGNVHVDRRPVPTVYSELDEIHNQQKAIHDSFRSGELLLPRGGYEDPDNFQLPQEQFQYPPMSPEYVENENPDTPATGEEEEYGNEDETIIPQRPQPEPNYYDENMSFDGQVVAANPNEDYPPPPEPLMIRGKPYAAYKPSTNNGYFNARLPVPVFPRKSHKTYKLMQSNHQLLYGF